jgi:tetratricopeptide (TPR) repeat protein
MAEYYFGSGLTWMEYLQANSFIRDVTGAIRKNGNETRYVISEETRNLVSSNEALSLAFEEGFDEVSGTLSEGFGMLGRRLDDIGEGFEIVGQRLAAISGGIERLGAAFEWGMGLLAEQLAVQDQLLGNILQRLDAIHETLQTPTLTQAREFYNIGKDRLGKGLLDKALEALLKAEEKNDTDFLTQYELAHLYLYGMNEDCNVIDLPKAEKHFRNAARYAKAEIPYLAEANKYCGKAYFHASVACYVQAGKQRQCGQNVEAQRLLQEAINLAQHATEVYPELSEGFYQHAKTCSVTGETTTALQSLKQAIKIDRNYCLKADLDRDFDGIRPALLGLFENLRQIARQNAQTAIESIERLLDHHAFPTNRKQVRTEIETFLQRARNAYQRGTYFDYVDTTSYFQQARETLELWRSFELDTTFPINAGFPIVCSRDGRYLASGGYYKTLEVWDIASKSKREIASLTGHDTDDTVSVECLTFSQDGRYLASADSDKAVRVWNIAQKRQIATLVGHEGLVFSVAFSPDGRFVASADSDKTVRLWDIAQKRQIATLVGHNDDVFSVAFSPDGRYLASAGRDQTVRLWDIAQKRQIANLADNEGSVSHVAFSPDGRYLASASEGSTVRLWDIASKRDIVVTYGYAYFMTFTPEGSLMIIVNDAIQIWGRKHIL